MAASYNRVHLIGALGRDPESRSFQNGGKVVNLRLATTESWKDKQTGERKEKTEWHQIAVFNEAAANFAERYLRKGSKVFIEGQLQTRKWQDQQGNDRYSTEVVVPAFGGQVQSLDGKTEREDRDINQAGGGGGGFNDDLSDEVPF